MCGITLFVAKSDKSIIEDLLMSINNIQNRGYDSVGIAYTDKNWNIKKYSSLDYDDSLEVLINNSKHLTSRLGFGHTRWATHGGRNNINSHPHKSMNNRFIVVHNGIITNFLEIKNMLKSKNYIFKSETDTEVICNLLDYNYIENNINLTIVKTLSMLEGTWALVIADCNDINTVYITRKGSPLLLGENENYIMCTSELSGFNNSINNYINIENNDILTINKDGYTSNNEYTLLKYNRESYDITPEPFIHWTLKEIMDQSKTSLFALNNGGRILNDKIKLNGLSKINSIIPEINHILALGCGTSYHACMIFKNYMAKYNNIDTIQAFDASEFSIEDIPKKGKILVIVCTQSGETYDLIKAIELCKYHDCIFLGVTNVVDSMIAKMVDCGVYINAGRERGVASTKSFTSMLVVLSLISYWIININNSCFINNAIKNLRILPSNINYLLNNSILNNKLDNLVSFINDNKINNIFLLGCDKYFAIAKEAALKIKEITYIHAEAYSGAALKHGPMALLDDSNMTIIILDKNNMKKLLSTYYEVSSRTNNCYILTNANIENIDKKIDIIDVDGYDEILYIITMQLLSYKLSISRNINPDKPRNLAKVVTVE